MWMSTPDKEECGGGSKIPGTRYKKNDRFQKMNQNLRCSLDFFDPCRNARRPNCGSSPAAVKAPEAAHGAKRRKEGLSCEKRKQSDPMTYIFCFLLFCQAVRSSFNRRPCLYAPTYMQFSYHGLIINGKPVLRCLGVCSPNISSKDLCNVLEAVVNPVPPRWIAGCAAPWQLRSDKRPAQGSELWGTRRRSWGRKPPPAVRRGLGLRSKKGFNKKQQVVHRCSSSNYTIWFSYSTFDWPL